MKLTERKLEDLSQLTYKFYTCLFDTRPSSIVLVVAFAGEYGYGAKGDEDAKFMRAVIKAGLEAWHPSALILDLQAMSYQWGDMIGSALEIATGRYIDKRFPTAVLISDRNREGMTSFVVKEMADDPAKWLFESLEDALNAFGQQYPNKMP